MHKTTFAPMLLSLFFSTTIFPMPPPNPSLRAIESGYLEKDQTLTTSDVNRIDATGHTLLHRAAFFGNTEDVIKLLSIGANPNSVGSGGNTPLHWAVHSGELPLICALLVSGADFNAKDNNGDTPLDWANLDKRDDIVRTFQIWKKIVSKPWTRKHESFLSPRLVSNIHRWITFFMLVATKQKTGEENLPILPPEILTYILNFLSLEEILQLARLQDEE